MTGLAGVAAVVSLAALTTVVASPDRADAATVSVDAVADTQISTRSPARPNGTATKAAVCGQGAPACSVDGADEKRALVKFAVSGVTTAVTEATLRLYVRNAPVPALEVRQTTSTAWEEATATWNNAADQAVTDAVYVSEPGPAAGWVDVDVTGAVTGDGSVSFVVSNPVGAPARLATRETSTAPQLVLTTSGEEPEPPPEAGPMNVYLGTTHAHTGANNDHGVDASSTAEVLATARTAGLDFIVLTEHAGPTGPADGEAFYADAQAQARAASVVDRFAALAGYEYSENGGDGDRDSGHLTGWGTAEYVDATAPGMDFDALYDLLVADRDASRQVFAGFNHPVASGHPASAPALLSPERRDLVVMSETSNKVGYRPEEEAAYYQGYLAELDRGWRVAPTCGLDTHGLNGLRQLETSTKKPCRTGVLAPTLTQASLVRALQQRRIYSTRDINLQVSYRVNDAWMGSQVGTPDSARFDVTVSDPDTGTPADAIRRVEVVGEGGAVLASQTFGDHEVTWQPTIPVGSHRYMFVRVFNGERSAHTALAAPVWFE